MESLPDALAPLAPHHQFICYFLEAKNDGSGKSNKFPVDYRTGRMTAKGAGGAFNRSIWTDHATAIAAAKRLGDKYGVGFVITKEAGFWFLDIDNCLTPENTWSPIVHTLCNMLPGAAIELSSSRKGLHLFGRGAVPPGHATKNLVLGLEFYSEKRFVAFGKDGANGNAATDLTDYLPAVIEAYFRPQPGSAGTPAEWTDGPIEGAKPIEDDDALIAEACSRPAAAVSSKEAFGGAVKASFNDLWAANEAVLSKAFPEQGGVNDRSYGRSEADLALAVRLAYWTGKDCERMDRLMRRSALQRPKYDEHRTYLSGTILKACANCEKVYGQQSAVTVTADGTVAARGANLQPGEQLDFFKGCVYVSDAHKILIPGGDLKKPDQFRALYGGRMFVMDAANERRVRDPYEAFLESQVNEPPRADSTCFRPDLPPATIVEESGRKLVNTYWPYDAPRMAGDCSRFMAHIEKLLPVERDRTILLSYMAAIVQHKGVKFQWAPLIQGAPGNGKTLFTLCVEQAVGEHYTFMPPAADMTEKFNSWLFGKLLIGVEDIFVQTDKVELIEVLKPMITAKRLAKRSMNTDQTMQNVTANFMFNSNHKDGLRKTSDDRRFAVFYTAQQSPEDIARDGMGGDYFPSLYEWLHNGGFAIVTEMLHTYAIPPEFNPAGACHRAPITSSTNEAIEASIGGVEQEVKEAIEVGSTPGFLGGWVSSIQLDRLLKDIGRRIPRNKRNDLMKSIGYIPHPHLPDGRVNNPVPPDGGRPRLYVHKDHPAVHLVGPAVIAQAYASAQMAGIGFGVHATQHN